VTDTLSTERADVSAANPEPLTDPSVIALLAGLSKESGLDLAKARQAIIDGWARGERPVRAAARVVPWESIVRASLRHAGYRFQNPVPESVDRKAFAMVPPEYARRLSAVCCAVNNDTKVVTVAVIDPTNTRVLDELTQWLRGYAISYLVADRQSIQAVIANVDSYDQAMSDLSEAESEDVNIRLVDSMLNEAVALRASDLHLEPVEDGILARYRRDGVLATRGRFDRRTALGLINRIKAMAEMTLDRRNPYDGSTQMIVDGQSIDLRVATVPTVWDMESVVVRLLAINKDLLRLDSLFGDEFLEKFLSVVTRPDGMFLVVGPTGSGKTTTLAAALSQIATVDKKTMTVEDPVEYRLPGITQVEVNDKAGLTFQAVLKSFLRSDPDIIMIGEIRDSVTAQTAVRAAQTGHLVLGSAHITDAAGAPGRLVNLGADRIDIADNLAGVMSQRLARRLCTECREAVEVDANMLRRLVWPPDIPPPAAVYRASATGCGSCADTGYNGRIACPELLEVTPAIAELIANSASAHQVRRVAVESGMVTMRDRAAAAVAAGITSIEELERVLPRPPTGEAS
jgi:type IV pilus assembly protein PilB